MDLYWLIQYKPMEDSHGKKERIQRPVSQSLGIEYGSPRRFNGVFVSASVCRRVDVALMAARRV